MTRDKKRREPIASGPSDSEKAEMLESFFARGSEQPPALEKGRPGGLVLCQDSGGLRHYLDGEAVRAGDILEFLADDGAWIVARYEWTIRRPDTLTMRESDDSGSRYLTFRR